MLMEIAWRGDFLHRREPAFAELLLAALLVELHGDVRLLCLEIGGGSLKARWPFSPMPMQATSMG